MNKCQVCGGDLPPEDRQQLFTDAKGRQEFHMIEMATWLTNKDGRLDDVTEWHAAARGSKKGLVVGYSYRTGKFGHEGKGEVCGLACAMKARARPEQAQAPALADNGAIPANITGRRLQQVRRQLGLTTADFALVLGHETAAKASRETIVRRWECGARSIPVPVQRLALMFELIGIPRGIRPFDLAKLRQREFKL